MKTYEQEEEWSPGFYKLFSVDHVSSFLRPPTLHRKKRTNAKPARSGMSLGPAAESFNETKLDCVTTINHINEPNVKWNPEEVSTDIFMTNGGES